MKSFSFEPLINKAYDALEQELIDKGFPALIMYQEIEDFINASFKMDTKQNCLWIVEITDVLRFALSMTFIEDYEFEEFMMKYYFNLTLD